MGVRKTPDAQQECAQCRAQEERQLPSSPNPQQSTRTFGRVIILEQYLSDRVQELSMQLTELEQSTGVLMNQLIREPDQVCAHQLQRTIGRLDGEQALLNQRLRNEKRRLQLFMRS